MPRWRYLPVLVGLFFSLLSVYLWRGLLIEERARLQRQTRLEADDVMVAVRERTRLRLARVGWMARRWENWGPFPQEQWEYDARQIMDPGGFRAIELVEPTGRVRWAVPAKEAPAEGKGDPGQEAGERTAMERAREERAMAASPIHRLAGGEPGFRVYIPFYRGGQLDGYMTAVFALPELLPKVLEGVGVASGYQVAAYANGERVYVRKPGDEAPSYEWIEEREAELRGVKVRLEVWPSAAVLKASNTRMPARTLAMGLGLSWLLGLAVWLAQRGEARAEALNKEARVRELAEEALKASEEKFRALAETAASAIFITREDKFLYLNRATEEILGYAPEELKGKDFWQVIYEEDQELVRRMRQARLEGQAVEDRYEFRVVSKNGEIRWVDFTAAVVSYEGQAAVLGTAFDVTDRKKAEGELRASEEHYRLLFEQNPHPMWVFDNETLKFLAVNEAAVKQYGYTAEEFLGMTIKAIRPASELAKLEDYLGQLPPQRGTAPRSVWRHQKKDGTVMEVEVTSRPIRFNGREARLVLAVDVTEKRRGEEALRKSEKMLAESQRVARLGSWEWDIPANQLYWSEETYRILGVTPEEMGGRMDLVLEVVHSEDRERVREALEEAVREKKPFASEHRIVRPDGEVRIVYAQAEVSHDEQGSPQRMVGIVHDITEQRRLEEQFQQSQKMEAVGRLAGGVAHDFNNLLMLIRGYSELMLEHAGADETEKQYAREVIEAADRAAQLTQQLLAFSRKQVLEPRVVSVNDAVAQMEKMLRRVLGEDIELGTRRKAKRPWVKVDPTQLEQVILNLAVNARDAMPKGGLLTVETANVELDEEYARQRPEVTPGEYVMLAVSDTGVGMTEEVRAHAFDPFFTTKEKGKGTGLGLATVYGIVRQSGGNIWVYSEAGKGTTFKIYFPLVGPPGEEEAAREAVAVVNGTGTVLLVEDEEGVRRLGRQFLEASGYRVLEAKSASHALELMGQNHEDIDVLMTDVIMPQMSGRELAERVVKMKPGVRVLYMSGYTDDVIVRHGELEEGTAFLQKPFTRDALAKKLKELLGP